MIEELGRQNMFAVVNLYNHGRVSFQASDLEINDYAGSDQEQHDIQEDPTQQELTVEPPTPPTVNPTLPEDRPVRVMALEDGTIMQIHGDNKQGYQIRRGDRAMQTRFPDLALAEMFLDIYRARHRDQNSDQDYIPEH